eukprot:1891260-Pleurochrysis_carterae.AAC.1
MVLDPVTPSVHETAPTRSRCALAVVRVMNAFASLSARKSSTRVEVRDAGPAARATQCIRGTRCGAALKCSAAPGLRTARKRVGSASEGARGGGGEG